MVGLTSAAGLVGFLSEPDVELQTFALERLDASMDSVWTEASAAIATIEALYEDTSFPDRSLAAIVLAKLYYQLQEYDEAMVFALRADQRFDFKRADGFEETMVAKFIDTWVALQAHQNPPAQASAPTPNKEADAEAAARMTSPTTPFSQLQVPSKSLLSRTDDTAWDGSAPSRGSEGVAGAHPDPLKLPADVHKRLKTMMTDIFETCYATGAFKQVVGIAVEARNMDFMRAAIKICGEKGGNQTPEELMEYVLDICVNVVQERGLRNQMLQTILDLLNDIPSPDYFSIVRCVVQLDQHKMASAMLKQLVQKGDQWSWAIAYQLSFDLYENGTQEFLQKVIADLPEEEVEGPQRNSHEDARDSRQTLVPQEIPPDVPSALPDRSKVPEKKSPHVAYASMRKILQGTVTIDLNLEFLFRSSRTDKAILNKVRDSLEARNSIFHSSVTFANAFMHAGTTIDSFFRENLEWLGKAVNWSKFTATAALGVIHRGNLSQGRKLLDPYLPRDNSGAGSAYSQGGSLFALGLIYTNHGTHVLEYLRQQFTQASDEVVQHGGALGVGVAGMATGSNDMYDELNAVLYQDSAVNGEAVGLAMGLVMLGTGNSNAIKAMLDHARETQHEKIVRGLALGVALIMYARQEAADDLINTLLDDTDPALRYGGILTVALAYCGSGSNKAVRRLLHVAVSDVSDDVRRVAVMSLGFVLFRKPGSVPRLVELLSESYNPHVRYGASMALGIACAGTGQAEAIDLLEPMLRDSVDYVRQGALIAMAMVLVQQNDDMNSKVSSVRKQFQKIISDRHEDAMSKFGCALALGIIDAGGRNCTLSLQTQTGNLNMTAIVGMAIFTQYWYWFPFTHFLSLSFTPTSIIGVDQNLEVPLFKFHCNSRPSQFDYPPEQEVKQEVEPEKVKTAVLSTTAQAKRRKLAKDRMRRGSMDIDQPPKGGEKEKQKDDKGDKMEIDEPEKVQEEKEKETGKKKPQKEPVGYDLDNMSRVLPAQVKYITFPDARFQPVKMPTGGPMLVIDTELDQPKSVIELKAHKQATASAPNPTSSAAGQTVGTSQRNSPMTLTEMVEAEVANQAGAQAAAGVLTAVDEGDDDGEEAPVPDDFEVEE
ncbi:26S proteasome regulatory complex, non-ATPase subcomplex, Rpn2/Psmd1 subunit [Piedraia hortae CBS 480.64]|uniref:26S proteasome regulatory subunit RPN2 n=1 Tax=Piedraia hortae CBS 480.64 TaxID=1314780 RepID=A0A6A7BW71_9PEZI|nr:26S proteasome regulatory complex, non-ATPase subcomplex, Rpn2/Psmd1 subunit [Piedraia hortae CBS 480.64]